MNTLLYKEDTFKIIGICMEVHNQLSKGFSEVVYSDALEIEFIDNNIKYLKEQKFNISYKGNILPHKYRADSIINDTIILEIKAIQCLTSSHVKQTLNYLAVSKLKIGLLINFGEDSLKYKRVIL